MFIAGLVIGPILGLLVSNRALRGTGLSAPLSALVVALIVVFFLFVGFMSLELRLGLIAGFLLGVLLDNTPYSLDPAP